MKITYYQLKRILLLLKETNQRKHIQSISYSNTPTPDLDKELLRYQHGHFVVGECS